MALLKLFLVACAFELFHMQLPGRRSAREELLTKEHCKIEDVLNNPVFHQSVGEKQRANEKVGKGKRGRERWKKHKTLLRECLVGGEGTQKPHRSA